jgi:hypothetical protein
MVLNHFSLCKFMVNITTYAIWLETASNSTKLYDAVLDIDFAADRKRTRYRAGRAAHRGSKRGVRPEQKIAGSSLITEQRPVAAAL